MPRRIFAGQPDPTDASHFTIAYEWPDCVRGTIDGRLRDDDTPGSPVDQTRYAFHERAVQCTRCSHPNIFIKIGDNRPIMHTNGYEQCNLVMEAIDAENFTWIVRCSKCGNEDACVVPMPFRQKR
jgi:hypothetical protein